MTYPTGRFRSAVPIFFWIAFCCATCAEVNGDEAIETATTPNDGSATETGPLVGAYYYPWYGIQGELSSQWDRVLRQQLEPPQTPRAGLYRSDDPAVIKEHIAQSRTAGLGFWAVSWWGPDSPTDRVFREHLLTHPDAENLRFAVLYESTGRFGSEDHPSYEHWLGDLAYLQKHYFDHPQYLRIDGRPALFVYLTRVYFRDGGKRALADMRQHFKDVYLIGDDVFGPHYRAEWAQQFDAITAYDVYGQSTSLHGATRAGIAALDDNFTQAKEAANSVNVAFIPSVAPGYNDTVIRRGHPGRARYLADDPDSQEGDFFRTLIRDAALPHLDSRCGKIMMVTSFNEWFEDSQIEATTGASKTTTRDKSPDRRKFTAGDRYEDYGSLYLDILRETSQLREQHVPANEVQP